MFTCDPILTGEILIIILPCFGKKTGRRCPILDPELWINVFKMFAHGCGADSEDQADFGV
jgi:hypothetical protein